MSSTARPELVERANANIARHLALMAAARPSAPALKIPRGRTAAGAINYLTLTFPRNASATDITYAVQGSPDLSGSNWSTISVFSGGVWSPSGNVTETSGTTTVRDTAPISSAARRFLRLEITH